MPISFISIPQDWNEAYLYSKWKAALVEEMKALVKNETWDLVTLLAGKKPVESKWVFTVKQKVDGSIERYKTKLVTKGLMFVVDY